MKNYTAYNGYAAGKKRIGPVDWETMQKWNRIVKLKWRGVK